MLKKFWNWYERHYWLNLRIAAFAFSLQVIHLAWLTSDVVLPSSLGTMPLFENARWFHFLVILIDYIEIPSIVTVSFVYIHKLRSGFTWKSLFYLAFLNLQWLHIFWITDEFVIASFTGASPVTLSPVFAWFAIMIDYLELPVIHDTIREVGRHGWVGFKKGGK